MPRGDDDTVDPLDESPHSGSHRHWLRRIRLPGSAQLMDISVIDGVVESVHPSAREVGRPTHEENSAGGSISGLLLLPSFHEHHAHLDKALTADAIVNISGDLEGAISSWIVAEHRGLIGFEEMQVRAEAAIRNLVLSGVTRIRTHVNVGGSDPTLRNLRAVDGARRRYADFVDVEIVALLHSPLAGDEGKENRSMLDKALEYGIDLIGGCPHLEGQSLAMIDHVLSVARSAQLPIDLHVDETLDPSMSTLEMLAASVIEQDFEFDVTASHCVSLSQQPLDHQLRIGELLKKARIRVVALPQTNLFLQGWDHPVAMPRGIAPLKLLLEQGVAVAAGGDNVQDPFNPMGRFDPLETASLLVIAAHLSPEDALAAVSTRASTLFHPPDSIVGLPADFVAVAAGSVREALADPVCDRYVVRRGRVIASTTVERNLIVRPV